MENNLETAVFGGGCFWGIEAVFSHVKGVQSVVSGYAGGTKENPSYEEVSRGRTGHAETVQVIFDSGLIKYEELVRIFLTIHDPTTLNRQGVDVGSQYRSIILYTDEKQKEAAEKAIKEFSENKFYNKPIVTEIKPLKDFYPAEEYHQKYFEKHPAPGSCYAKLEKLKEKFSEYYK
ncbi:MAG: peptide-methionine (S)-S-oxide reductase MsrA [Candidatus Pacebacteria bacterium]|nr:peptide-methionine (S)-S-oxide reductase MsrA [Candidatus Paceibacterota bacterium]